MAATYSQLGTISNQQDFQSRVAVALNSAAIAIYNESTGVTGHALRAAYATKVINGDFSLPAVCRAVVTASAIQASASPTTVGNNIIDTDIQNQVNAIWNALAGA